jgi:hypothetical protein
MGPGKRRKKMVGTLIEAHRLNPNRIILEIAWNTTVQNSTFSMNFQVKPVHIPAVEILEQNSSIYKKC